tara:strand:- start:648 stop:1037 length:390 start_codon:yes stop_codon:yes gene_type:complete
MEKIMKNLALILCLLVSPLTYASYHGGTGGDSSSGSSSGGGGGYGGGSGGAAALIAVGAIVYFMSRDTDEDETESAFVRRYNESNFRISVGSNNRYFENNYDFNHFNDLSNKLELPSNNFQLNLTYKFN